VKINVPGGAKGITLLFERKGSTLEKEEGAEKCHSGKRDEDPFDVHMGRATSLNSSG